MKPEPVIIRFLAGLLGFSIAVYCAAMAYGINLQANRDSNSTAHALAIGVAFWGLLLGGGLAWSCIRRRKR